jgi:hypothetical protein
MVIPANRRAFLRWAARGAAALGSAGAIPSAEPEPPQAVPVGVVFQIGETRYRLGYRGAKPSLDLVPRWEWPDLLDGPQPIPTKAEFLDSLHSDGRQVLVREWEDGAPRACRLCTACGVVRPDGPRPVCIRLAPAGLALADAALYQEGGGPC